MATILVRRARLEEADTLTELAMRAKASWGYDEAFMARCRDELTLTPAKMEAWAVWVAERDGLTAGMIALARNGDRAELEDFMVEPTMHAPRASRLAPPRNSCRIFQLE